MDLDPAIRYLRAEVEKLNRAIAELEKLVSEPEFPIDAPAKRGRKSMGTQERLEVSARMKRYWAKRRRGSS